jgi:hypothetical protein
MNDAERRHHWLTQAELDAMLKEEWHRGFYDGSDAIDWNHEQERMTVARAAYQRGAEAMREAAATRAYEIYQGCLPPDPWVCVEDIKVLAEEIRALPIFKDKP